MAEEFNPEPIMNCSADEPDAVSTLTHNVLENGMYKHLTEFPSIPEPADELGDELTELDKYRNSAKGNSDNIKKRNDYSKKVHKRMKRNLKYAKLVCGNDVNLIILSGFPSSQPPEPATIPLTRNIKDIVKGHEEHMVQVILEKAEGTKKQRKEHKTYIVRVFLTENATEYTEGCVTSDSRKLFVRNIPVGAMRYYQIIIQNSAGSNELAPKKSFTLL
jgi:hypothetical protein